MSLLIIIIIMQSQSIYNDSLFCNTCTRQFQRKHAYEQHIICCPRLFNKNTDLPESLPTQAQLYAMVVDLHKKCNKMQNEIRSLKSMDLKEKKKINNTSWLEENKTNSIYWETLIQDAINYNEDSIHDLKSNKLDIVIINIIHKLTDNIPVSIFSHKKNIYYIYHNDNTWKEYNSNSILKDLYKNIQQNLTNQVNTWASDQGENLYSSDHLSRIYSQLVDKVIGGSADDGLEKIYKKLDTEIRKKCIITI